MPGKKPKAPEPEMVTRADILAAPRVKDDSTCVVEDCYDKRASGQVVCQKHIRTN